MKFDSQIPIGKAVEKAQDDDEVTGHGLILDTGEPAASDSHDSEKPAGNSDPEIDGKPSVPDKE